MTPDIRAAKSMPAQKTATTTTTTTEEAAEVAAAPVMQTSTPPRQAAESTPASSPASSPALLSPSSGSSATPSSSSSSASSPATGSASASSSTSMATTTMSLAPPPSRPAVGPLSALAATSTTTAGARIARESSSAIKRHLLTIEKLRNRVHQILKCVINLHIDILVIESNVNQLIDDVKELNNDLMEVQRLDNLIQTLRDYNGPTICHEWPFPLMFQGTIDEAEIAQTLNTNDYYHTT